MLNFAQFVYGMTKIVFKKIHQKQKNPFSFKNKYRKEDERSRTGAGKRKEKRRKAKKPACENFIKFSEILLNCIKKNALMLINIY